MTQQLPTPQLSASAADSKKRFFRSAVAAEEAVIELARKDPATFCAYVLKDERTGKRVRPTPYHEQWHRDLDEHANLVLWSNVESGKTNQITIGRTLFELGNEGALRNVIVSATAGQAIKILKTIARYIEHSDELHRVFPNLRKSDPWLPASGQIFVKRNTYSKDPSVQALGVHGAILGARIDRLYLDDVLSHENVRTEEQREEVFNWYGSTLSGRLTDGSRVRWVGQAWHPGDAMHRFERLGWPAKRYPVIDERGNPAWPERWSLERIDRWRKQNPSHIEYMRQLLCLARDDAESRFRLEWINKCKERGEGLQLVHSLWDDAEDAARAANLMAPDAMARLEGGTFQDDVAVFTGVDLAVQKHAAADKTVFFTAMLHPNGDRQILNIESGRWSAMEIIRRAVDVHRRLGSILIVENNSAQNYIIDLLRDLNVTVPVRAFTTGMNKAHIEFGVESMGAELEGGRWIIPNELGRCEPEVDQWIHGLLTYQPDAHTNDHLMASWFCREGMRAHERSRMTGGGIGFRSI